MMPEMPIDPNYGRFIDGITIAEDGTAEVEITEEEPEVEEQEDGSAVVRLPEIKGPEEDTDFYENLAETEELGKLEDIAFKYLDYVEKDKEARKDRDKQYEEGLRRTGLGNDAPGGANFNGGSSWHAMQGLPTCQRLSWLEPDPSKG